MILLDTGVLFALLNGEDAHHGDAVATMAAIADGKWGQPIVSDLVVAELFTLLRARKMPAQMEQRAVQVLAGDQPLLEVAASLPAPSGAELVKVLALFTTHRKLSFTDAALLHAARTRGCALATFDSGFTGLCEVAV